MATAAAAACSVTRAGYASLAEAPPHRQSLASLREDWDPHTLATFSLSQLDALSRISAGWCPLLSRAVRCTRHSGGSRRGTYAAASADAYGNSASSSSSGGGGGSSSSSASAGRKRSQQELAAAYLDEEAALTRRQALAMLKHVWKVYEGAAFGKDQLRPLSGKGEDDWGGIGQTLVDSLDTLWLAGMREEFDRAADWVEEHLTFDKELNVNFFETSIRHLGGLLAAYWLSRRDGILTKARDLGNRLLSAYRPAGTIPAQPKSQEETQGEADTVDQAADASQAKSASGMLLEMLGKMGLPADALMSVMSEGASAGQGMAAMLEKVGITQGAAKDILTKAVASSVAEAAAQASSNEVESKAMLPFSDINLRSGQGDNLASFVSLAEAYMPVEWKALALFTGNCTYATRQDEVLMIVNQSQELSQRGFAPILLKPDGTPFPSPENRISVGGRGDSFYEYLLKDYVFSGHEAARQLWQVFCKMLPSLLVEVDPDAAYATLAAEAVEAAPLEPAMSASASGSADGLESEAESAEPSQAAQDAEPLSGRWRQRWRPTRGVGTGSDQASAASSDRGSPPRRRPRQPLPEMLPAQSGGSSSSTSKQPVWRGAAGARGGWYENARDVVGPWLFVKEVTASHTVAKMDHLMCFLPGALALDVLHSGQAGPHGNVTALKDDRSSELLVAHRLAQTCVHMYFRTATDMAPEITRFNSHGLVDDLGSMHSILRPETIESLTLLWRTTKAQIYRNWGQRIVAAFSRMRTPYGYASLHNVNKPWDLRDDMPSFFFAETLKYFYLLFSDDSVLSLTENVLNTEAHPLPRVATAVSRGASPWLCDGRDADVPAKKQQDRIVTSSIPAAETGAKRLPPAPRPPDNAAPTPAPSVEVAEAQEETGQRPGWSMPSAEPQHPPSHAAPPGPQPDTSAGHVVGSSALSADVGAVDSAGSSETPRLVGPTAAPPVHTPAATLANPGDPTCWILGYTYEACCYPASVGNPACWDMDYTYARCCLGGVNTSAVAAATSRTF